MQIIFRRTIVSVQLERVGEGVVVFSMLARAVIKAL
jgi:hypothetical protein